MNSCVVPVSALSIWDPIHLGTDETGKPVYVTLAERNMLIGGEPGAGKSSALQLIVAHAALSTDCVLILIDGKQVELGLWQDCADTFVGPDSTHAMQILTHLQQEIINKRTSRLVATKRRKITRECGEPIYVLVIDELAFFSATVGEPGEQKRFSALVRDIVARGRAPGVVPVIATQRPSADVVPTSLRDLFGYRWAFRCSTEASSDTILGHGWSDKGYCATDIDPSARGVSWLRAEDGIPKRVKAAYLTDQQIIYLAEYAAALRTNRRFVEGGEAA